MNISHMIVYKQNKIGRLFAAKWLILFILLINAFFISNSMAIDTGKYQFGVFPHMSSSHVEKKYSPLALQFGNLLNKSVRLGTSYNIDKFRKRVTKGAFDIVLIPPLDIVTIVDKGGYIPLARAVSKSASIVVLNDSELNKIDDLKNKTLGLPSETPVNIILQLTLNDRGFVKNKSIIFKAFNNVQACLHKLLLKKVDACGSASGISINLFQKKMGIKLRAIMETQPFPHMLFVAHPRLSFIERKALTQAILGQDKTEQGKKVFQSIGKKADFIKYKKQDYDVIREYRKRWMNNAKNTF